MWPATTRVTCHAIGSDITKMLTELNCFLVVSSHSEAKGLSQNQWSKREQNREQ